jgi:hypothetical protein
MGGLGGDAGGNTCDTNNQVCHYDATGGGTTTCTCRAFAFGDAAAMGIYTCTTCPATQPTGACMGGGLGGGASCTYGDTTCTCGNGGNPMWTCGPACPATQPTTGDACTTNNQMCPYGGGAGAGGMTCRCRTPMGMGADAGMSWQCF